MPETEDNKSVIDTSYSIDLNTPYRSIEVQYVILSLQNTPYRLGEQDMLFRLQKLIRCIWIESLIRRIQLVDTSYPTGGCGISSDLP
ncbi:hypothetical protein Tco_0245599 [Tanacetum coccineum]